MDGSGEGFSPQPLGFPVGLQRLVGLRVGLQRLVGQIVGYFGHFLLEADSSGSSRIAASVSKLTEDAADTQMKTSTQGNVDFIFVR